MAWSGEDLVLTLYDFAGCSKVSCVSRRNDIPLVNYNRDDNKLPSLHSRQISGTILLTLD